MSKKLVPVRLRVKRSPSVNYAMAKDVKIALSKKASFHDIWIFGELVVGGSAVEPEESSHKVAYRATEVAHLNAV